MTRFEQPSPSLDTAKILRSVGDVAYEWQLDTDALVWAGNAGDVLGIDPTDIASGEVFARHVDVAGGLSRAEVIQQATRRDAGKGVPYQIQYAFRRGDEKIWIEDTGRWFAGPDGKPKYANGIMRTINERHERERWLEQRAKFDPLTGELNRIYLTESSRHCARRGSTLPKFLRVHAGGNRPPRAPQRSLWI